MKIDGHIFKTGAAIVYDVGSEDEFMKVAIISSVYVVDMKRILFKTDLWEIDEYQSHLRVYTLRPLNETSFFYYNALPFHHPLHPRICRVLPNDTCIIVPFHIS